MKKDHHFLHYLILIAFLAVATVLFSFANPNRNYQFIIVVAASLAYIVWGIMHHMLEGRADAGIILEYVLIGLVVILGFWGILS